MSTAFTTRFAPSPTGRLHLGHAFSAVLAHDAARAAGGRFLLRIEDIDAGRCRPAFTQAILDDLAWLGLTWDADVRRQSDHIADYQRAIDQLRQAGLVYRCFRTRSELAEASLSAPHGRAPVAPSPGPHDPSDEAARLEAGAPYAWRLSLGAALAHISRGAEDIAFTEETLDAGSGPRVVRLDPSLIGDVVLARKDTPTSYHLAVTVDDALQGVTHIIRGEDLFEATHVHVLLQRLLGLPTPRYRHHRLLAGPDGKRYAKRDASVTLDALRSGGATPDDIRRMIGLPA
ncbi:tRNA glutamyl-Q(34) synthetase GluQRS [bacterium]|nr:tRNA glutamyl-Q(34) synthetase GluQRS [bacterium]